MARNTRVILIIRIVEILIGLGVMSTSIGITVTQWQEQSTVNSAWAGALVAIIAILMLSFFLRRPIELWPLPLILDCLGVCCSLAGIAGLAQVGFDYYYDSQGVLYILPLTLMASVPMLFIGTAVHAWLLQRQRKKELEPSDPLKPYLMKKEIDVWCYPVQNETGGIQYVATSTEAPGEAKAPKQTTAQSVELAQYPPPSIQGDYRIDHIEIVQNGQQSVLSQPLTDTVAGWSVPSKSATLRLSQITPGTFSASLRSPTIMSRDEESQA